MVLQNLQRILLSPGRKHGMFPYQHCMRQTLQTARWLVQKMLACIYLCIKCPLKWDSDWMFLIKQEQRGGAGGSSFDCRQGESSPTSFKLLFFIVEIKLLVYLFVYCLFFLSLGSYSTSLLLPGWHLPLPQERVWVCASKHITLHINITPLAFFVVVYFHSQISHTIDIDLFRD